MGGWFSAYGVTRFLVNDAVFIDTDDRFSMSGRKGIGVGITKTKCFGQRYDNDPEISLAGINNKICILTVNDVINWSEPAVYIG